MQNNRMTDIIYDYFVSRILTGYYRYGDRLPSVGCICTQFQVSALTARAVLQKIRENGYIETTERKASVVIYEHDSQTVQLSVYNYLSRKKGLDDIWQTSGLIFNPIARFYFSRQNADSIRRIRSRLKKVQGHAARQIICLYSEAMQTLNNALALNLFWEVARHLHIPFLDQSASFECTDDQAVYHIKRMLKLTEGGESEKAVTEMQAFSTEVMQQFFLRLQDAYGNVPLPEQIPFQWQIYREHPQVCYTLAAEIMGRIDRQIYRPDEFLPSCQALALEYGVSSITMRRTLELLSSMHVTETLNGIGTKVSSDHTATPDFSHPQLRKSLIVFLQALQIAALTAESTAKHTLTAMGESGFHKLSGQVKELMENGRVYLLGKACFRFIGDNSASAFVREVYQQLYQLLLWGHVLHLIFQKPGSFDAYLSYAERMLESLHRMDAVSFARLLSELLFTVLEFTRELLLQLGFQKDQLINL